MRPANRSRISVIIPVFNGGEAFELCLEAIASVNPSPDQIIVVDDGSTDRSAATARAKGFHVISVTGRSGAAHARNLGARHAVGEVLFFVDADCSVQPDAIERIRALLQENPDVDAFVGSYDDAPTARNLLSQYKNLLHHRTHQMSAPEGCTFWGACGVIRRETFQQMGGFDSTYTRASIEDIELGYRLKAAGKRIRMCPSLQVTHHKEWRAWSLLRTDLFLRAIPWGQLILKAGKVENALNINRVARLRVALSGLIALCLAGAVLNPKFLWLVVALASLLLVADWNVLRWLFQKRGAAFTLAILPWHWFSHLYSGFGFVIAILLHLQETFSVRKDQAIDLPIRVPVIEKTSSR